MLAPPELAVQKSLPILSLMLLLPLGGQAAAQEMCVVDAAQAQPSMSSAYSRALQSAAQDLGMSLERAGLEPVGFRQLWTEAVATTHVVSRPRVAIPTDMDSGFGESLPSGELDSSDTSSEEVSESAPGERTTLMCYGTDDPRCSQDAPGPSSAELSMTSGLGAVTTLHPSSSPSLVFALWEHGGTSHEELLSRVVAVESPPPRG